MKAFAHFCTITKHKKLVLKECFRVGLYKQGLLHDMSKYSWTEFRVGCRYYQGTRSPKSPKDTSNFVPVLFSQESFWIQSFFSAFCR